jgi:CRP/FNR family transcriptional regulator, cyclic AMP receptor protein
MRRPQDNGSSTHSSRDADKRALLKSTVLFGPLGARQIERLGACVVSKSVPRSGAICAKGEPGSSLFVICKGTVKISSPSVDGHDAVFNLFSKGDIFGEIALLDGGPRTADAVAVTRDEPEIAIRMIEIVCAKLRHTSEQAENLMFMPLRARLAKALLRLSAGDARASERKAMVTQKDLGNIIGMSRESTNRQLRLWEQQEWVRLERGGIVILAAKELERIAESDSADGMNGHRRG